MGSYSVVHWIIFFVILYLIYAVLAGIFGGRLSEKKTCTTCGVTGPTKTQTPGSVLIEIVLWLCFIIPGVIYSLWRHSARKKVCGNCNAATLVPPGSPAAIRQQPAQTPSPATSVATELEKLVALRDRGALTNEEFAAQKARLLQQ